MAAHTTLELASLYQRLHHAPTYSAWSAIAHEIDLHSGAAAWKQMDKTKLYDYPQLRQRLEALQHHRQQGNDHALLFALNEGIHGNLCGMGKAALYGVATIGTKQLIEDYVDAIVDALEYIAGLDDASISREEKLDFFHRASHCYGRTALMLSGGGALGHFHVGVIKALLDQQLLPNILSGSSVGSLVTAICGTHRDDELRQLSHQQMLLGGTKREAKLLNQLLFGRAAQIDVRDLEAIVLRLVPDLTFQEALALTGRHINISVAPAELHQTSRLLNAITSPNVYIRKAVMASCAVPGVYPPVMLEAKNVEGQRQPYLPTWRWIDGSVSDDLPAKRLARLYGVNHYIGSLINPIMLLSKDGGGEHTRIPQCLRNGLHSSANQLNKLGNGVNQRYTRRWQRITVPLKMFDSILSQKYSADINIYADFRRFDLRKILSHLTELELIRLEQQGARATWPHLERIRISSKIGLTLDRILATYTGEERRNAVFKHSA